MLPIQSVNTIIEWERRLEVEDQKRKEHRSEMHASYLTLLQSTLKDTQPLIVEVFKGKAEHKLVSPSGRQEVCCETQP